MKKNRVAVFITAFNEERTIGEIIALINDSYDVYIIDDGSSDTTADIAREKGAYVISHPVNLGQGMAVLTAFKVLSSFDYDIIIEIDGDGQHDPREIDAFVTEMNSNTYDIIAGSRILGSNYKEAPFFRRFFLKPLTMVINVLSGYCLSDSMCGFRAFRGASLARVSYLFDDMIEPEYIASEMWIRFAQAGLTVGNLPIHLADRRYGISYKGLFRYGWGVFATIVRTKLETYKHKYLNSEKKEGVA